MHFILAAQKEPLYSINRLILQVTVCLKDLTNFLYRYCLADERLEEAVKFLDLGDRAGWELLQAMLNADYRKRPMAEAVLSHRFLNGVV